jgi:hypothetical protein
MDDYLIIEPHYIPNIQYFLYVSSYSHIIFDDTHIFEKQSYRNRASILTANKVLNLIVPVKKGKSTLPFRKVAVDNKSHWQKNHWTSIQSAYNKSPYFVYYKDQLWPFFQRNYFSLLSLNMDIFLLLLDMLSWKKKVYLLSEMSRVPDRCLDARNSIHPKKEYDPLPPYTQVFDDRFPFKDNLSIIDLIFNEGPYSGDYLLSSPLYI